MIKTFELDDENIFLIKQAIQGEMRTYRKLMHTDSRTEKGVPEILDKYQKLLDLFRSDENKK